MKTGRIWVNPKVKGEEGLDTRLHEAAHLKYPNASEKQIRDRAKKERDVYKSII